MIGHPAPLRSRVRSNNHGRGCAKEAVCAGLLRPALASPSTVVTVSNHTPVLFRPPFLSASLQTSWAGTAATGMLNKTDTRALDKRNIKRTKMVVGLRVSQQRSHDADLLVHTLDISSSGAKIGALRELMQPGSTLIVQRRQTRARCLIMWSRKVAPGEIQIGVKY